jgi:RND superfamily putative drug exporter
MSLQEDMTAMGDAFDAALNDDSFYLPPEAFATPTSSTAWTTSSPGRKSVRFTITHQGDPLPPEGIARIDPLKIAAAAHQGHALGGSSIYLAAARPPMPICSRRGLRLLIVAVAALILIFIIMIVLTRAIAAAGVIVGTVVLSLGASSACRVVVAAHRRHPAALDGAADVGHRAAGGGCGLQLLLVSRMKEELHAGINTGILRSMVGTGSVVTAAGLVFAFTMISMSVSKLIIIGQGAPPSAWACCSTRWWCAR